MKRFLLLSLLSFGLAAGMYAQQRVSGTVTDESGSPLIGATVVEKGTSNGTITDIDGNFNLEVANNDAVVTFSYTGYQTQEVAVSGQSVINIALAQGVSLEEVVVTGYTAQRKRDLTGAVGVVSPIQLKEIPTGNITSQLQGRVSGVNVSGDGRPGVPAKVRIRGFATFTGFNDPLYIVDGVPTLDIDELNPDDVESMSVLKDAGAASIYGSRSANGVILIKTKQGPTSGVKVNYSMYYGSLSAGDNPEFLLNAQEYADLQWLVYRNDGTSETHPVYGPSTNAGPTLPSWGADTDWWDVITQNAFVMNHHLSLAGGNENARFYAGLGYFDQDGIVLNNFTKRVTVRLNSEYKVAKGRLTIGENLTMAGRSGLGIFGNGDEDSPVTSVYRLQPLIPHIIVTPVEGSTHNFVEGDYGGTGIAPRLGNSWNEYARRVRNRDDRERDLRVVGSVFIDLEILKGLNVRSLFGGTYGQGFISDWTGKEYENAENIATSAYTESSGYFADWVWTNTLSFDKKFDRHGLLAVAGYEAVEYDIGRVVTATRAGYFSDDPAFRTLGTGAQITAASSFFATPSTLASAFIRVDYSFNDRYYVSGTLRRDGSSRFGPDFRYGTFPSVSAAIRVSDFFEGGDAITDLKIRGGYGQMGNQFPVPASNQFNLFGGEPGSSNYAIDGNTSGSTQGFRPTQLGNADSKWETQVTTNIGFDASLFKSKVQIGFDWYQKTASDLLVQVPRPSIYGAASLPALNIGEIKNSGIDLQIDYRTNITSNLSFDGTLAFTSYKNEILKFTDDIDFFSANITDTRIGAFNRNEVGFAISQFYGYQVTGIFQSTAEVDGAPDQDGAEPGFFRYQDTDGDGEITPLDRVFIGNPNPDFTFGVNLGLKFKGFDFSAFVFGSQGNDIFNYNKWWLDFWPSFQGQKSKDLLYNSWSESNPGGTTPKASNKSNFSNNTQSVSYYVEDGSFIRLKNLQFGYSLPNNLIERIGVNSARVYVQGVNLLTATDYSGLDPDVNNQGDNSFGVDLGNNPLVKQFLVGVQVGF
jgi:TonB-linked SusC/RagA family outer membrane protein